jgi:hypothetical protein
MTDGGPLPMVRRLAGDVQRFGLLSAATVVDRYVDAVDRTMRGTPSARPPGRPDTRAGADAELAASVAGLAQAYADAVAGAARVVTPSTRPDDGSGVSLGAARPGGSAQTSLWLHNPTGGALVGALASTSTLLAAGGAVLDAAAMTLDPAVLPPVPPGGTAELRVRVQVPLGQAPGTYHGLVLVSAAPEQPLPIRVQVVSDESAP